MFSIPLIGYVASYVQNPPGRYIAFGACFVLIVLTFFSGTSGKKKNGKGDEEGKDENGEASTVKSESTDVKAEENADVRAEQSTPAEVTEAPPKSDEVIEEKENVTEKEVTQGSEEKSE